MSSHESAAYVDSHINLGVAYLKQNQMKKAQDYFKTAVEIDLDNAIAHNDYGHTLALEDKLSEAIKGFQEALELNPNLKITQENLEIYLKKIEN